MTAQPLPHPVTGRPFPSPVPPGSGWPGDPAAADTPVARAADDVARLAATADLSDVEAMVSVCRACPRLVDWREQVALRRRRAFADQQYWGRPVPGWGQERPRLLIVGLAALSEEMFFRGFVFSGLRSRMSVWPAAVISGLVFGLVHAPTGITTVIPLAVFGVALAWLYDRTGSLWPSVTAHAINNGLALAILSTDNGFIGL